MSDTSNPSTKQLLAISPEFYVQDVVETAKHYRDKLGFTIDFLYGDPPFHASVSRDGIAIIFHQSSANANQATAEQSQEIKAYICVSDVAALCEEFKSGGANIIYGPEPQSHGMREMNIKDCNGCIICFGQEISC